jgi:hypothetical protein
MLKDFATKLVRIGVQSLVILAAVTVIGQIRMGGLSLEGRYHSVVNSEKFQTVYWTLAKPFTWTGEKAIELIQTAVASRNSTQPLAPTRSLPEGRSLPPYEASATAEVPAVR